MQEVRNGISQQQIFRGGPDEPNNTRYNSLRHPPAVPRMRQNPPVHDRILRPLPAVRRVLLPWALHQDLRDLRQAALPHLHGTHRKDPRYFGENLREMRRINPGDKADGSRADRARKIIPSKEAQNGRKPNLGNHEDSGARTLRETPRREEIPLHRHPLCQRSGGYVQTRFAGPPEKRGRAPQEEGRHNQPDPEVGQETRGGRECY